METILTVKQERFEALVRILRLYIEADDCVCDRFTDLPLLEALCPPDCDRCLWCMGRAVLRSIGQRVDA